MSNRRPLSDTTAWFSPHDRSVMIGRIGDRVTLTFRAGLCAIDLTIEEAEHLQVDLACAISRMAQKRDEAA